MQISEEASNLTKALKADTKKQGNWGEVILDRILEASGLIEDESYTKQGKGLNLTDENGNRFQPDVIINLPDNKHIVIDSKVSLLAYERLVNCETEEEREAREDRELEARREKARKQVEAEERRDRERKERVVKKKEKLIKKNLAVKKR